MPTLLTFTVAVDHDEVLAGLHELADARVGRVRGVVVAGELGLRVVPTRRDLCNQQQKTNPVCLECRETEELFARRVALTAVEDFRQAMS